MLNKEYLKLKPNSDGETHLCVSMDYDLGGMNYFNYTTIERGYYLYCIPCVLSDSEFKGRTYTSVRTCVEKGLKKLLKKVTRKSKKAEEESTEIALASKAELISAVCKQYGYELEDNNE